MTYIVDGACIRCKYQDCVSVCPVDCFYAGPNTLVINPDECIDCGVCEPECPAEAIQAESEENIKWQEINREYAEKWPNITVKKDALEDADEYKDVAGTFEKFFSDAPGEGA